MDHSQFYMKEPVSGYGLSAVEHTIKQRIEAIEKDIRQLKGIPEPEPAEVIPVTFNEILKPALEGIFADMMPDRLYFSKNQALQSAADLLMTIYEGKHLYETEWLKKVADNCKTAMLTCDKCECLDCECGEHDD